MRIHRVAAVLILTVTLMACSTVPVTGRRSLSLVSDSELASMSLTAYQKILEESELSSDPEQLERVNRVGWRIADATEQYLTQHGYSIEGYEWEFNVLKDDETVNAWAMPGGKVAVYTGLLPLTQDDAGLATVLGHEVAHVLAGHGNERMSQSMVVGMGGAVLSAIVGEGSGAGSKALLSSYGAATQVGVLLPFSRKHESEADRIGLTLMAIAGYDPRAAIPFWERMNEQGGDRPPTFLATHPAPANRIEAIRSYLPEALAVYGSND